MRKPERFLRQSRMALCAAGLIGLGVTSANAALDFEFDVQSLKLDAADTATSVAGQGYNQVLIAPGTIVGLQLNAIVTDPGPDPDTDPLGTQRAFWSAKGDFLSGAAGPLVDITGAGAEIISGGGTAYIPAIAPFNKSGATGGTVASPGGDNDLMGVWVRKAPVSATDLAANGGVTTIYKPEPNVQDAATATWYVGKVDVTGKAALGTGSTSVSFVPSATEVLYVDDAVRTTGATAAGVAVTGGAAGSATAIAGKAVTKVGSAGAAVGALNVAAGASLTVLGGGVVKADSLTFFDNTSKIELGQSGMIVDAGGNLSVFNAILGANLASANADAVFGLGYSLGSNPDLAANDGTFGGQAFGPASVLVKLTKFGDANLDGDVDLSDVNAWISGFTGTIDNPASPTRFWADGDWDYDGDVDLTDVNLWIGNFTGTIDGPLSVYNPGASVAAIEAAASVGITVVVPEPASMAVLGLGAMGLLARRSRRK